MPEMPRASEGHRQSAFIRRRDHFRVAHRAAWLDGRRRARFRCSSQTICKRKECIAANHAASERQFRLACFPHGDAAGINAAHLARAYAQRPVSGGINNRVRLDVFYYAPAE